MTDYEWLTKMGLCHKCRREKTAPGRKFCFDCLELIRQSNRMQYSPEKAKEYRKRRREIYHEKKEKGICVRCSQKATHGMYCYEHYIKQKRRSAERSARAKAERHERGLVPDERKAGGLCLWCGEKAVPGMSCCEKHSKIFSDAGRKAAKSNEAVNNLWKLKQAESKNSGSI